MVIGPVPKVIGRPRFTSLRDLKEHLMSGLKKVKDADHPNYGHSGYLISPKEYAKISTVLFEGVKDIGAYIREVKWRVFNMEPNPQPGVC